MSRLLIGACMGAQLLMGASGWRPASGPGVEVREEGSSGWRIVSSQPGRFALDSVQEYQAAPGDTFEIELRWQVDVHTRALPELACYDASGREIPGLSPFETAPPTQTTNEQSFRRIFPARPGTALVRARLRGDGQGEIRVFALEFRPARIDPYQTGALISQIYPGLRRGLVLESNLGIVNRELVSPDDRDGDGKWAEIFVDLDELSHPEHRGVDWRSGFQYRPDVIYWSDGAVLKSDTVREDRAPDRNRALHFRMKVHQGPYRAILNDPGRAVAVSLDGRNWKRYEGGREAELGVIPAGDGFIEFWVDACYRDPVSAGPVYFDYVRLFPVDHAASAERLFQAARRNPVPIARGSVEEKKVNVSFRAPELRTSVWPVRCGLPIPQGELASAAHAAVLDAQGRPVPSQNRALATWPDGSVKWLYLDFQFDPSAGGERTYTVVYGNGVQAARSAAQVLARELESGIEVDTGAVRFTVSKRRFGMVENVRLASGRAVQAGPVAAEIAETGGKTWRALELPVDRLQIEQAGPLHTMILAETETPASGRPAAGFAHRARIHAYAGSPLVEIDYFVANTDGRQEVNVRSIALKIAPAARIIDSGALLQATAEARTQGWMAPGGAAISVGLADFREQYPSALRWTPELMQIDLWAPEGGDYRWVRGVGKTHHVALLYGGTAGSALLESGPVLATASPEWYSASGAFGPIATAARSPLPAVEKTLARHMADKVIEHVGLGFENYGDHSSSGYVQGTYLWENNEYDLPAACMVHFARTGDTAALRLGLASALHYLDVDTIHYSSQNADWAGAAHTHSHGTVGHHTADPPGMHHAGFVQGLIWYSYFTGNPEGVLGAKGIAEWVLRNMKPESSVGQMERATGHPMMTLNDVYEATWDDQYLRGAARLADWALKWEDPVRSGFPAPITEQPAYYSGSPFCGGLLPSALMKFNSWARVPEIDAMLERVARWTLTDMWRPPAGLMSKGGPVTRDASPNHVSSHLRLMGAEFVRTGDPLFLAVPREMVVAGFGENAKQFGTRDTGLVYNYLPWFLHELAAQDDPQPGTELLIRPAAQTVELTPGGAARACVSVRNRGAAALEGLRIGFQARLDFRTTSVAPARDALASGAEAEFCTDISAPELTNLTSQSARISYAHWTALYRTGAQTRLAHAWLSLAMHPRQR